MPSEAYSRNLKTSVGISEAAYITNDNTMLNTPSRNQKLLALLIIVISLGFMVVAYKANQQTQNIAPRAQVSTTDVGAPTTNTGANTTKPTMVTQLPPNGQPPVSPAPPEQITSVPICQEGIKSILADPKDCAIDQKTGAGTGPVSTTATGTTSVSRLMLKGIVCWNDNGDGIQDSTEFLALNTGCITKEEIATYLTQAQDFCKGKKAPSCSGTVPTPPSPRPTARPSAVPSTNCATKSKGDVNCDGRIDLVDFNIWLSEFNGLSKTLNADVNGDGRVSGADFDVWRQTYTSGS